MINFTEIKQRYSENPLPILRQLVGEGKIEGNDYVALNPRRNDSRLGSFRIDIQTGHFHDFATEDRGGSVIDLAMFVHNCGIVEAAQRLESLFPFLASTSVAADIVPAKKKKLDTVYIWNKSTKAQHQYLNKKKVTIGNARVNLYKGKSQLVIPLTDTIPDKSVPEKAEDLEIKGLQFIYEDGDKIFPLPFMGLFHIASDLNKSKDTIVIAEGYATSRSIAESTDLFAIAAMSSCNLKNVAEKIAKQFQKAEIIIAADNDEAGRKAVTEAQKAISGKVSCTAIYPSPEFNDFNDMYQAVGAEELREFFSKLDERNKYHG
ncbi:MAG: toprim domain-containing protein [Alphaproteobacteria bacterium]|nr:toprim domain-containing protein [Alphaproteobacteria bacterium]